MNIRPLDDRVLVKVDEEKKQTASGIVLPNGEEKKPVVYGTVISVGAGCTEVKDGERIVFARYSSDPIKVEGTEMVIIEERDILCVVE